MKPLSEFPPNKCADIRYILTDIDDTITYEGRIPAAAYTAMENLNRRGIKIIPITGRPAGWCDHFARMWPVDGVVGENGAFYFLHDKTQKRMIRRFLKTEQERKNDNLKLERIKKEILEKVPGCAVSADQKYREADLAIDFAEDVAPLSREDIEKIADIFIKNGATAKISSIHVNGWFGEYDKLSMTKILFQEVFNSDIERIKQQIFFVGDSPNDEPMFRYFPCSIGVANVLEFKNSIKHEPAWITDKKGGFGFSQIADLLIQYM